MGVEDRSEPQQNICIHVVTQANFDKLEHNSRTNENSKNQTILNDNHADNRPNINRNSLWNKEEEWNNEAVKKTEPSHLKRVEKMWPENSKRNVK